MASLLMVALWQPVASAQETPGSGTSGLSEDERAKPVPEEVDEGEGARADWSVGSWGNPGKGNKNVDEESLPPFGAHLFEGGFRDTRADGMNPNYRVVPGDQITLRVWGAVEMQSVLSVDSQGNVFISGVGPVPVQGASAGELNNRITSAIRSVYPDNVEVYTNLQGVQPVAVYVTGFVNNPGRYAGVPTDSLLYFVAQAEGIDPVLGSYRQVDVMRNGKVITSADLYDFLLEGELPRPQFKDGDTIIVREKGPTVAVTGEVARPYAFELSKDGATGGTLLDLARLKSDVSHVLLRGFRGNKPISEYVPLDNFTKTALKNGDDILFSSDKREEYIVVQLEGSFFGPSRYVLPRDASLHELLDAVAVPPKLTATKDVSIRRKSIAERQKIALEENLQRLESTYLGASSSTPEEAEIRVKEAELITEFVKRARDVEPSGRLVVADNGEVTDLRLRDGDVVTLPEKSDSILISGEVVMPQSVVFRSDRDVEDYIESAGGFSSRADDDRILVVHANGEVDQAGETTIRPGDEILVLPKVPTKNLQLATNITQILYQIAIAAKVALDL
ncbi:polysaccharide biosynthesis/export family protein [Guyparkeria hydrothermalis]|uniref:polysaccharide biosynthesis/export family protein n=1 Tax=Guyparkeria hydrothermalis TaxID=923 RepID=UPI002021FAE9|nr:polysaccharide biosynthesis/export family protein [Guyparkeria hydrothermalis]MCL7745470.1 polysaccharide biosynthesis/export family protein [Guyparkeria hydrothermalis]